MPKKSHSDLKTRSGPGSPLSLGQNEPFHGIPPPASQKEWTDSRVPLKESTERQEPQASLKESTPRAPNSYPNPPLPPATTHGHPSSIPATAGYHQAPPPPSTVPYSAPPPPGPSYVNSTSYQPPHVSNHNPYPYAYPPAPVTTTAAPPPAPIHPATTAASTPAGYAYSDGAPLTLAPPIPIPEDHVSQPSLSLKPAQAVSFHSPTATALATSYAPFLPLSEQVSTAKSALRELKALQRQRELVYSVHWHPPYGVNGNSGSWTAPQQVKEVDERYRMQRAIVLRELDTLRRSVSAIVAECEGQRWRRFIVGGVL
mgnify:CR=1 FL=1